MSEQLRRAESDLQQKTNSYHAKEGYRDSNAHFHRYADMQSSEANYLRILRQEMTAKAKE